MAAASTRVLVGGAEGALGQAAVQFFLDQKLNVVASCRTAADGEGLQRRWGEQVAIEVADLADGESVQGLFARLSGEPGPIKLIFNGAGGFRYGALVDCSQADYGFLVAANQTSTFQLLHYGVKHWRQHKVAGRYFGISAAASLQVGAPPNMAAYLASKRALNALIESAAAEFGAEGITVNAVAPTIIDTPVNRQAMPDADPGAWVTTDQILSTAWAMLQDGKVNGEIRVLGA